MEKPQEILDPAKGVSILPPAEEMRKLADKRSEENVKRELHSIAETIKSNSERGAFHFYIVYICQEVIDALKESGYKVDFDMTANQPAYKISW